MTAGPAPGAHRSAAEASYRFHADLERPGQFLRREWRALAIFGGTFIGFTLAVLFSVDATFFYPRIETDQLLYLLKTKSFVETGSTAASLTVNGQPFSYASMPGLLRAPFLYLFTDFDAQLRGIQVMNVLVTAITGAMSAFILSWTLPRPAHRWAIAFTFGFLIASPDWVANLLVPMADTPYAALTLACVIIAAMTLTSARPLAAHRGWVALFVILFATAFFVRLTAPVLLVFAGVLAWQRWRHHSVPRRVVVAAILGPLALVVALTIVASDAILGRYLWEPLTFARNVQVLPVTLYLLASALPSQIVPVFNIGFEVTPLTSRYSPVLATTPRDMLWTSVGLLMSAIVIRGIFALRRRLLPELIYFLAALPVLTVMTLSTIRYLMTYQPIIWACFFAGLTSITVPVTRRVPRAQLRLLAGAAALAAAAGVLAIRSAKTASTAGVSAPGNALTRARAYASDVENTFGALRTFLETTPRASTLLVGGYGDVGRFTVIANRLYYWPDSNLVHVAREKQVYAVLACGTAAACGQFDAWIARQNGVISRFGDFGYRPVFDHRTRNARALVRRLMPSGTPYSASGLTDR